MYQKTNDVGDLENHGYLKYMNLEAKVMVKNKPQSENSRWLNFTAMDLEDEAYMFLGALDRMGRLVTSCLMKRGEDQCRIKVDGRFNFIHMALVRRIRKK